MGQSLSGGSPGIIAGLTKGLTKLTVVLGLLGSAVPAIGGLVGVLSQLAPIALVLPGAILGMAAAYGALKVGMSGVGDALKGDAEAMAKLAPSARATVQAIRGFRDEWEGVKQATQGALFDGLADQVKTLGKEYLPVLKTGLSGIAGEFNAMGKSAAAAFAESRQVDGVSELFANVRQSIAASKDTLRDFLVGFLDLGIIGSDYLQPMAEHIARAAAAFRAWASDTDRVRALIDGAIAGFQDLFAILGNIGYIVGSVWSGISAGMGAGAGSPLASIRETTAAIAELFTTVESQDALRALGQTMGVAGTAIREILLAALQALMPIIQAAAPLVQVFAQALSTALTGALAALGPPIASLVQALAGALAPILPIIAQNIVNLANAFAPVIGALGPVVAMIGSTLAPILQQLMPIIQDIAIQVGQFLVAAFEMLAPIIPPVVAAIGQILVAVLPLIPIILQLAEVVLPLLGQAMQNSVPFIQLVASVIQALMPIIRLIASVIVAVVAVFTGQWDVASRAVDSAVKAIGDFINVMLGWFGDIPGKVVAALGNLGSLLVSSGRALIDGFWSGLKSAWNSVVSWVKEQMAWLRGFWPFSPAKRGAFAGTGYLTYSGKAMMSDWGKAIQKGGVRVGAIASDVMSSLHGTFSEPLDANIASDFENVMSKMPSGMSAEVQGLVSSDDFGLDSEAIATAVVAGLTGSRLTVDGNGLAKFVNKTNTRTARRG